MTPEEIMKFRVRVRNEHAAGAHSNFSRDVIYLAIDELERSQAEVARLKDENGNLRGLLREGFEVSIRGPGSDWPNRLEFRSHAAAVLDKP